MYFNPSYIYLLSIAAIDLLGVILNIQMLLVCFKKEKYSYLQKYRLITACQFVYQMVILATNTMAAWRFDVQHEEACSVFKVLSASTYVFLLCNLAAISSINRFHHRLMISAALASGFVISLFLWSSICFATDIVLGTAGFNVVVCCLIIFLLISVGWSACRNLSDHSTAKESKETPLPMIKCSRDIAKIHLIILIYICLGLLGLLAISRSSHINETTETSKYEKFLFVLAGNFVVGVALPVALRDYITDLCHQEQYEMEKTVDVSF